MAGVLVIGSSNTDLVCRAPRLPAPGETIAGHSFNSFAGGKGANQAVAAARAGARVVFVGACGDDPFGTARRTDLASEGIVITNMRVVPGATSGVAAIVVDDAGENQIVYVPGANALIAPADTTGPLSAPDYRVLSLTLEVPLDTVTYAVRERRVGALVVLNAAPHDERLAELLPAIDVLIVNEIEAEAILERRIPKETAPEAALELTGRGPEAAVITLGADGAAMARAGVASVVAAPSVDVIDTTGAGDAFCGALSAWLAAGESLQEAVRAGVAAGALAVTRAGAQPSLPDRDAIMETLRTMSAG